jgi:hypothetical protein
METSREICQNFAINGWNPSASTVYSHVLSSFFFFVGFYDFITWMSKACRKVSEREVTKYLEADL